MNEIDTPLEGPMSIDQLLDSMEDRQEATPEVEESEPLEAEQAEPETEEVEEEVEPDEQDEPSADEEGPEVYDAGEYGEIAIALSDGTQTTLADLVKGNLRQADYSRKTAETSQRNKALDEREAELAQREQRLTERLASQQDEEPDWVKLAEEDPLGWQLKKLEWDKSQAVKAAQREEAQKAEQKQRDQFRETTALKAVEVMPEWSDPGKFKEGASARLQAALDAGFTKQEFDQAIDFRLAVILEKAARYDAGQKKVSTAVKKLSKAPKVVKPGTSVTKSEREDAERAARSKRISGPVSVDEYLSAKGVR